MIRLLMKSGQNIQIDKNRARRYPVTQNILELKDPVSGNREFIGGNYVNFSFDVLLVDNGVFNSTLFNQLDSVRYQECNLEIDGEILSFNSNPYEFFITNATPFYLDDWNFYEVMNISLGSLNWTPEAAQFLIDDLGNIIKTSPEDQGIIVSI